MIRIIRKLDDETILAWGPKFDIERVLTTMLDIQRRFAEAVLRSDADFEKILHAESTAEFFRGLAERFDVIPSHSGISVGNYHMFIRPLGYAEFEELDSGEFRTNWRKPPSELDVTPYLTIEGRNPDPLDDATVRPEGEARAFATAFLERESLRTGITTTPPEKAHVIEGVLCAWFPHAVFGQGESELRIHRKADFF